MIISQQAAKKSPVTNMSRIIKRSLKTVAVTAAVSAAIVISVQQCFQSVLVLQRSTSPLLPRPANRSDY